MKTPFPFCMSLIGLLVLLCGLGIGCGSTADLNEALLKSQITAEKNAREAAEAQLATARAELERLTRENRDLVGKVRELEGRLVEKK